MTNKYRRARKKRKKWWPYLLSFFLLVVLGSGIGAYLAKPSLFSGLQFWKAKKTAVTTPSSSKKKKEKSDFLFLFGCFSLVVDSQIDTLNLFFLFLFGKYEVSFAAFEEIYFIGGKP